MVAALRFERVIEALAAAMSSETVADVIVGQAAAGLNGTSSVLLLLDAARTSLVLVGATAVASEKLARWRHQPLADNATAGSALMTDHASQPDIPA